MTMIELLEKIDEMASTSDNTITLEF